MGIQIFEDDCGKTSIRLNGEEMAKHITEFALSQKAEEIAVLQITIPVIDGIEVDIPNGVVELRQEAKEPAPEPPSGSRSVREDLGGGFYHSDK